MHPPSSTVVPDAPPAQATHAQGGLLARSRASKLALRYGAALLGLLAIVGEEPVMRATVITRTGAQQWQTAQAWDTVAPRLHGFPEHNRFTF
jgi:protein-L-isoaspartate(D-aspartate) O-methyltransferase